MNKSSHSGFPGLTTQVSRGRAMRVPGRFRVITAILAAAGIALAPAAQAVQVCFNSAGTSGRLTATTAGPGCGTFLNFGGINGLYMGDSNTTENCTFTLTPAVVGNTVKVPLTAHSCVAGGCEEARFSINGSHYAVQPADLDNTTPPGGTPVSITVAGDILGSPVANGDGRATISFNSAPASVTTVDINHVVTAGSPAGTIYLVCADDGPAGPAVVTGIPTLSEWALYAVGLLLAVAGVGALRRRAA